MFFLFVVHATTLDSLGEFQVDVAVALGKVDIIVFLDQEGNGPDAYEPMAKLEGVRVGLQDVQSLDFNLVDPVITRAEVEQARSEPIRPGTHLPKDLPAEEGNLSSSAWLVQGAQGGAAAILRTRSNLSDRDTNEDLGFDVGTHTLKIGREECVTDQHCIQILTTPRHPNRPRRR